MNDVHRNRISVIFYVKCISAVCNRPLSISISLNSRLLEACSPNQFHSIQFRRISFGSFSCLCASVSWFVLCCILNFRFESVRDGMKQKWAVYTFQICRVSAAPHVASLCLLHTINTEWCKWSLANGILLLARVHARLLKSDNSIKIMSINSTEKKFTSFFEEEEEEEAEVGNKSDGRRYDADCADDGEKSCFHSMGIFSSLLFFFFSIVIYFLLDLKEEAREKRIGKPFVFPDVWVKLYYDITNTVLLDKLNRCRWRERERPGVQIPNHKNSRCV